MAQNSSRTPPDQPIAGARQTWLAALRAEPALLLVLLFLVSLPAVTPRLYAADEIEYFAYLRSWWFDRDLSFDNEYRYFYDHGIARAFGFRETFLEMQTATGLRLNFGTVGCAILWSPFYAAADAGVAVANRFGAAVPADGFSKPYIAAVTYGSAVYGFLAVLLSAWAARRITGSGAIAAALAWLATPLVFYMYLAPGMAHACSAFAVALFVCIWLRVRTRWHMGTPSQPASAPAGVARERVVKPIVGGLVLLAAAGALMAMVREQDVLLGIGPAIDLGAGAWRAFVARDRATLRRLVVGTAAAAVTFAVLYLPQYLAYQTLYGHFGPAPQVSNKMHWTSPHALDVLLSPEHGFFVWTPFAALALAGLVWLAWRPVPPAGGGTTSDARWIGALALVMVAGQVYVNGSIATWSQAGAFGQRRFVGLTILLTVGIACLTAAARSRSARAALLTAAGLCLWWNLGLMVQFGAGWMDRQRLAPATNAYNTFITVPVRLPGLAYRYLFDRSSFYKQTTQ